MCVQWFTVCVLHESESPTMVVPKSDLLSFPSQGQPQSLTHKRQKRYVPNEWQFKREVDIGVPLALTFYNFALWSEFSSFMGTHDLQSTLLMSKKENMTREYLAKSPHFTSKIIRIQDL